MNDDTVLELDQLSLRGRTVLWQLIANKKVTVKALAALSHFDILMLPNIGPGTLREIKTLAKRHGVVLSSRRRASKRIGDGRLGSKD